MTKITLKKILNSIKECVYPEDITCFVCEDDINPKLGKLVCDNCESRLDALKIKKPCTICGEMLVADERVCIRCKNSKREFDKAISSFVYEEEIRNLIYKFKYENNKWLAKFFAYEMLNTYKQFESNLADGKKPNLILSVPLCKKHFKIRGYNQSTLILNIMNEKLNLPTSETALTRIKETDDQIGLSYKERQENMKDAFCASTEVKGKTVLLIDDVFTTGATVNNCAKSLKKAKAAAIYVLTFAHTKHPILMEADKNEV